MRIEPNIPRVMLDIETLGTKPGSVVFAIGAARFHLGAMEIVDTFYTRIDVRDAQKMGLRIDADTVLWWMAQSPEARAEMTTPGAQSVNVAVGAFVDWLTPMMSDKTEVWCKGSSFDFPLLRSVFAACRRDVPWSYWQERCCRTLMALDPIKGKTISHRADEDAIAQARRTMEILNQIADV